MSLKVLIRDRQEGPSQRNRGDDGTSGQRERERERFEDATVLTWKRGP